MCNFKENEENRKLFFRVCDLSMVGRSMSSDKQGTCLVVINWRTRCTTQYTRPIVSSNTLRTRMPFLLAVCSCINVLKAIVCKVCADGFYELMYDRRIFNVLEVIGPFAVSCPQTL